MNQILYILLTIAQSFYFICPAYLANMAPVIAKKLQILKETSVPIDFDNKFDDGRPIFGKHKTYRGLIVGILMGIIGACLQLILYNLPFLALPNGVPFFRAISIVDYSNPLLMGFLLGAGAITGDLIKSFFKRRINIESGKKFIPFDQIDFVLGAYLFVFPFYYASLTWQIFITSLIISFFLHILINHISFYLNIRKEKW